jgi:hypothetical protein
VVTHIESAIECKDIALGAFLYIEGAFDRTSLDILKRAAERYLAHNMQMNVLCWNEGT